MVVVVPKISQTTKSLSSAPVANILCYTNCDPVYQGELRALPSPVPWPERKGEATKHKSSLSVHDICDTSEDCEIDENCIDVKFSDGIQISNRNHC